VSGAGKKTDIQARIPAASNPGLVVEDTARTKR